MTEGERRRLQARTQAAPALLLNHAELAVTIEHLREAEETNSLIFAQRALNALESAYRGLSDQCGTAMVGEGEAEPL